MVQSDDRYFLYRDLALLETDSCVQCDQGVSQDCKGKPWAVLLFLIADRHFIVVDVKADVPLFDFIGDLH
jgi:hypothetical protein